MNLKPVDILTFAYLALVSILVAVFHGRVNQWYFFPLAFGAYGLAILALAWSHGRWPANRVILFLRLTYPLIAVPFIYEAIEKYVLIFYGHFLDAGMNAWEQTVFGVRPNIYLERFVSRPLTEFMMAAYFSYYLYIIAPPLALFFQKRYADLERLVFTFLFTFYVCYLGFVFLPVLGPVFSLKNAFTLPELNGYFFAPLQHFIMTHGDPVGTCFPSSHVAVAWAGLLSIRQFFGKKAFRIVLPFTACLTFGVVYNRYHYLTDAIAGLATAGLCYVFCLWFFQRQRPSEPAAFKA
jgi:hypothetical protein